MSVVESVVVESFDGAARTAASSRTESLEDTATCDVLVVGGGPVGLSLGVLLTRSLVDTIVIERHSGVSIHPKARGVFPRTMEVFRQINIAHDLVTIGERVTGSDHWVSMGSSLAAPDHRRMQLVGEADMLEHSEFSAVLGSQDVVERLLLRQARFEHVPLHFRTELVSFEQDADGVNAVVRHRDSGQVTNVRAKYLVGCDGSKSVVREQLGAAFEGEGPLGEFLNVLFDADLSALVEGRRSVGYMIDGTGEGGVRGSFLAVDNRQRWLFNFQIEAGSAGTYDDARLRSVLRSAIGAEVPLNIVSAVTWSPSARVADRYRVGRVLLAGDAAHVVPPNGATGMNCGVQDAHNLWWKLAGVVHGTSPAALLDTYELERRPIALRTAAWALAGHHAAAAGPPPQAPPPGSGGGESGRRAPMSPIGLTLSYRYDEGAFVEADEAAPAPFDDNVYRSTGRPGERTPHLMLQSIHGRHAVSEFVGPGWGLFGGPESGPWSGAIPFTPLFVIGPEMDPEGAFMERFGVGPDGVVLVRPDNVVAWRSRSWVPDGHERLQAAHRQSRGW